MADLVNNLKTQLGKEFSNADAFSTTDGSSTYNNIISSLAEEDIEEEWSEKYKKSINCDKPKGFSQKAYCTGKKKKTENTEATGAASAGGFEAPLFSNPSKVETKEATGSSSSGSYETPKIWAKSQNKNDWRGKSKPQIPGGKFVTIKEKCKTFPYCNQGDIKALKIYENDILKKVITKISKQNNISENIIKAIIQYTLENNKSKLI
jgi:hypothetical protein